MKIAKVRPLKKTKSCTVHLPLVLVDPVDERIAEIPYRSFSNYVLGLILFDLWSRRPHRYTALLMAQPGHARDAAIEKIAVMFKNNEQKSNDPGWFDHMVERVIRAASRLQGLKEF